MSTEGSYKEKVTDELERNPSPHHDHAAKKDLFIEELGSEAALNTGILGKFRRTLSSIHCMWAIVNAVDKYGVEARGIERVLPHERKPMTVHILMDNLWMWMAANSGVGTPTLGILGPSVFNLSGRISIVIIICFNLLGSLPVAFFSTFGPKLGLRQMTIARFSYGYYVAWFPVVLNLISCIGWSTINAIVGAQALRAVSTTHQIPVAGAIIIIAVLTFFAPFFGYKVVHLYERYSWVPIAIIYFILLGTSVRYMDAGSIDSPVHITGSVLSFGAAVFGSAISWSSYAADYTVEMPEDVSSVNVFWLNYLGLNIPSILVQCLGVGLATVTREDWKDAYQVDGIGGLIGAILAPTGGFGKLCLVLMALSIVAGNTPNMYSFALTFQVLGKHAQAIPRIFLVFFGTIVYVILAIVGASHFESLLDTLIVVISYWLAIYCTILIEEHFIFRKARWENYNVADYRDPSRLPLGLAAAIATCLGILGAVLGMATTWYIGVLVKKIGNPPVGGDIGFELSLAFTAVSYPVFRIWERRLENPKRQGSI